MTNASHEAPPPVRDQHRQAVLDWLMTRGPRDRAMQIALWHSSVVRGNTYLVPRLAKLRARHTRGPAAGGRP